ncbi:hypothetical protein AKI39_21660 [Bordetella sp. H567]|uniref:SDR family NAD(P)-dependent oxidoreductase n=1 Tax=Bordetella sp. H567 TaxID=1697043 RepID=UPI00081CE239|nr:SDR family oxidoreductase [Bordetella sp. H567]AOB32785.1 hypothetical protein AKI39_21660 [Bordetella sp. H567]
MTVRARRIIVTGAASGIGRAIALHLARDHASVALLDRDAARMAEVAREVGPDVPYAVADVSAEARTTAAVEQLVASLGGLDGLVNCAGVDLVRDFDDTDTAQWQRLIGVNLMGAVHTCRAAVPALRNGVAPSIVNVASAAALRPLAQRTAYCSSKAALVMFGKALSMDLAKDGIRVNSVCPGIVDTPMLRNSFDTFADPSEALSIIADRYLIKRPGTVDEIAQVVAFLLGDGAGYITGSALAVDGGRSFH